MMRVEGGMDMGCLTWPIVWTLCAVAGAILPLEVVVCVVVACLLLMLVAETRMQ